MHEEFVEEDPNDKITLNDVKNFFPYLEKIKEIPFDPF